MAQCCVDLTELDTSASHFDLTLAHAAKILHSTAWHHAREVARGITVERLFAASHLMAPVWYDPCRDRLTDFEGALRQIEAEARAIVGVYRRLLGEAGAR